MTSRDDTYNLYSVRYFLSWIPFCNASTWAYQSLRPRTIFFLWLWWCACQRKVRYNQFPELPYPSQQPLFMGWTWQHVQEIFRDPTVYSYAGRRAAMYYDISTGYIGGLQKHRRPHLWWHHQIYSEQARIFPIRSGKMDAKYWAKSHKPHPWSSKRHKSRF